MPPGHGPHVVHDPVQGVARQHRIIIAAALPLLCPCGGSAPLLLRWDGLLVL